MNETPKYEVFISYRRDGGVDYARMIYLELKGRGFNTFFDFNSLRSGKSNEGIFQAIDDCRYFILVLSENALDRCMNEDDWVRREIEYALSKGKEIIPVCPSGCTRGFPAEMPPSFSSLRDIQVSRIDMDDLFEKSFDKIVEDRFDADFRKGRDPVGAGGVSNRSFTKIGICVVAAILVAASAVTTAIMLTKRSDDQPVATEPARAAGRAPSGVYVFASGSPELKLREQLSRVRQLQTLLKVNGWNPPIRSMSKPRPCSGRRMKWSGGIGVRPRPHLRTSGRPSRCSPCRPIVWWKGSSVKSGRNSSRTWTCRATAS